MPDQSTLALGLAESLLGNRLSRALTRSYVRTKSGGRSMLENTFLSYCGEDGNLSLREKTRTIPLRALLEVGRFTFGVDRKEFKDFLRDTTSRRGIVNVLSGMAEYGVTCPQVLGAPFLVVWNYTNACNLRCKHCYQRAGKTTPDELTTDECLDIIDQFHDDYVVTIAFSGGEPLLRKDFYEVARYATEREIFVSVATNGTLLTKRNLNRLADSGVGYLQISLDAADPKVHDAFRGAPGCWAKTVQGIRNAVEDGRFYTSIATTITRDNYSEFRSMLELSKKLKVRRLLIYNFIPTGRGEEIMKLDIPPEDREELMRQEFSGLSKGFEVMTTAPQFARVCMMESETGPISLAHVGSVPGARGRIRALAQYVGGCGAGRMYCALQPDGTVTPCVFMPIPVGNVRNDKFIDIWRKSPVMRALRSRDKLWGHCAVCSYKQVCGGCRARAWAYFRDLNAPDVGCIFNKEYWDKCCEAAGHAVTLPAEHEVEQKQLA